jgi:hypothetical protein
MLKFSGYPYLIRGQSGVVLLTGKPFLSPHHANLLRLEPKRELPTAFEASPRTEAGQTPITKLSLNFEMTLEQACPKEYQRAQCAFKDSMIH